MGGPRTSAEADASARSELARAREAALLALGRGAGRAARAARASRAARLGGRAAPRRRRAGVLGAARLGLQLGLARQLRGRIDRSAAGCAAARRARAGTLLARLGASSGGPL